MIKLKKLEDVISISVVHWFKGVPGWALYCEVRLVRVTDILFCLVQMKRAYIPDGRLMRLSLVARKIDCQTHLSIFS
jgi:glutathionyl-hydroquinone reductase